MAPLGAPSVALLAAMAFGLGGCDNPVCVFADGCQQGDNTPGSGDTNSMGAESGVIPSDGLFLDRGAPEFLGAAPSGDAATTAHAQTPIFLEFSESLNASSLVEVDGTTVTSAFQLIATQTGAEFPLLPPQLIGDGRVVLLLPVAEYPEFQNFQLFFREGQTIADLNGQLLGDDNDSVLVDFSVDSVAVEDTPRVIYSYPPDSSINNADTSQIVIGFDRSMDGTTIDTDSFAVTVDGVTPANNPQPEAPTIIGSLGAPELATQVFTWTPLNGDDLEGYGLDGDVVVRLSDTPDEIASEGGATLPLTETAFSTSDFRLPTAVAKGVGAAPEDGFGSADVLGGAAVVDITLDAVPPGGTEAEFYLFGVSPQDPIFLRTSVNTVDVPDGVTEFSVTASDLGLLDSDGDVRFADGVGQVAIVLLNGGVRSAARLFDADPSTTDETESPFIDTTPPVLLGLGVSGEITDSLVGEVRDFAAFGRASEPVAFAFVDAGVDGTNGGSVTEPPATAFSQPTVAGDEAYFIAAPVPVGVVDPRAAPVSYSITLFDQALNESEPIMGTFTQTGVVGPGGAPTGSTVDVRVFNAVTLEPIETALVLSYQELSGAITFIDDATTLAGAATVDGAGTGSTIITVDAAGFDLFSFHGVPRDAVDILLQPTMPEGSVVTGRVLGATLGMLSAQDRLVQDTRSLLPDGFQGTGTCGTLSGGLLQCVFQDHPVRPGRLGALSVLGLDNNTTLTAFNAPFFLRNFALGAPFGPVDVGEEATGLSVDAGASTASGDGGLPVPFGATAFTLGGVAGLGTLTADPVVTVEAVATGLAGSLLIGAGQSTDAGPAGTFDVLAAVAGDAAPGGLLEVDGAIGQDSFMRLSATDTDDNQVVARNRFSNMAATTIPMDVPAITNPLPGSMTGGAVYNILVTDTLPDSFGLPFGLYRVELTDTTGRGWTIVGLDASDAAGGTIVLSVPDIAAQGGSGLQNGAITASVEVYAQNLDRGQFLWTDLEREHEFYSRAAPITFTQN